MQKRIEINCTGVSPLLMDQMSAATLQSLATGVRLQVVKDRLPDEVAKEKIYRDPDGRIALPVEMLFSCLVGAGRNVKIGRKGISTATTTILPSLLSIEGTHIPLTNIPANANGEEKSFWSPDLRKGMGYQGKTPTAVAIIRPKFPKWEFKVVVKYNDAKVNEDTVKALFSEAGLTQGLGSFRPNKKGMFGMFEVTKVQEIKTAVQ